MRRALSLALLVLPAASIGITAPAAARTSFAPYLEVQQVFTADLSGHQQDAVTYTGAAAGFDATLDGPRLHGQIDYRYDRYFAWSKRYADTDVHNGLASIAYQPAEDFTIEAAGIATRARGSLGRATPGFLIGDVSNTTQVYAIDVGPRYASQFGDLNVAASYDFGWTRSTGGQGAFDLGPGQPVLDNDFTTTSHTAQASVGMRPGGAGLPIGWSVSGGYIRDDIHFLDARYTGTFGRLDLTYPITDSLALTGGVGYEENRAGQAAILIDAAGNAVLDDDRHLQADKSKPRQLSYDQDGLIWDVGVIWRPSSRTFLEVHGGRRYGATFVTGRLEHQLSPSSSVQVVAYSDIQSFGRQLTGGIGSLPTSFTDPATSLSSPINLCVFGANGGRGGCLPALNSVNANFYRSRGIYANWSGSRGPWFYGVGINYDWRRYLAPSFGGDTFSYSGVKDRSVTADGVLTRTLSPVSSLSGTVLVAWYDSDGFDGAYTTYGAALSYSRQFSRHLSGNASISVSSGSGDTGTSDVIGTGLLALRYQL